MFIFFPFNAYVGDKKDPYMKKLSGITWMLDSLLMDVFYYAGKELYS